MNFTGLKQTIAGVAAAIVVAGGLVLAQGPVHANWQGNRLEKVKEFISTYLGLNDAQKAEAGRVIAAVQEQSKPILAEMGQHRQQIFAAVKAGDHATIETLSQREGVLAGQLMSIRANAAAGFYKTLTPEQQSKADKLRAQMRGIFGAPGRR